MSMPRWQPWVALALFAFFLNFAWEMLQVFAFQGMAETPHWDATLFCLRATLGDVLILWGAYLVVAWSAAQGTAWLRRPSAASVSAFVGAGVAATVFLEWLNVHVLGRWSYADGVPTLVGVGLPPLLQWILLPPAVLWLARRHLGWKGRFSAAPLLAAAVSTALLSAGSPVGAVGQGLSFPRDEGLHPEAEFEMWSLLSHAETGSGEGRGVAILFFTGRVAGFKMSGTFHLVADEEQGEWTAARDLVIPLFGSSSHSEGRLDESYDRSRLWRDPSTAEINALVRTGDTEIALSFSPLLPAVDFGQVEVGEGALQRLYVHPVGEVAGRVTRDGREDEALAGVGMFQHQWGDSPDPARTGSVFSIQLDDGASVAAYHGGGAGATHALSLSWPWGDSVVTAAFTAEPLDTLATGAAAAPGAEASSFPMGWVLRSAPETRGEQLLELRLETTASGQPVRVLGVSYWLGRCRVSGRVNGAERTGWAYVLIRGE